MNDPMVSYYIDADVLSISGGDGRVAKSVLYAGGTVVCAFDSGGRVVGIRVHDAVKTMGPCFNALTEEAPGPNGYGSITSHPTSHQTSTWSTTWLMIGFGFGTFSDLDEDWGYDDSGEWLIPKVEVQDVASGVTVFLNRLGGAMPFSVSPAREYLGPALLQGVLSVRTCNS